jgi:hypothetical protein
VKAHLPAGVLGEFTDQRLSIGAPN